MKHKPLVPVFAAIALTFAWPARDAYLSAATDSDGPDANYRAWRRVTPKRERMPPPLIPSCAFRYTPQELATPHATAEFLVYVNPLGEQVLTRDKKPSYPIGTVIVKEKYSEGAPLPHLLTVMRKHPSGYDPANGNWEYLVQKLPNGRLQSPPDVERCQSCHQAARRQDHVFRGYLPINRKRYSGEFYAGSGVNIFRSEKAIVTNSR